MNVKALFLTVFFLLFSAVLILSYSRHSQKTAISYWDEYLWVGESYFTQFFFQGDFRKEVWESYHSYDQPMLARYLYGLWIYPKFLNEKNKQSKDYDYTKFIIANGFYLIDTNLPHYHTFYQKNIKSLPQLHVHDAGNYQYYRNKYGSDVIKIVDLITYARRINFFLLAMAVLIPGLFFYLHKNWVFSFLFILLYGFNSLILSAGVKAHSEGLFVFLFNLALLMLFYFFLSSRKLRYLILFSIFSGLATSTKLNALMLYLTYLFIFLILKSNFHYDWKLILQKILLPIFIIMTILVVFNPYTYTNPPLKIFNMFKYRAQHTLHLSRYFSDASLPTPAHSIAQIFTNFYSYKKISEYNKPLFLNNFKYLGFFTLIIFLVGLNAEIKRIKNNNQLSMIMLGSFFSVLLTTSYYLRLNWDRYFIHLVIFFIYYQTAGIIYVLDRIKLTTKK